MSRPTGAAATQPLTTDERAELSRFAQCAEAVCGEQAYTVVARPRTFGVRFSQDF